MEVEDPIFSNDILYMQSLVGKKVSIETIENKCFEGPVYVIDPVYKSVILADTKTNAVHLLLYKSIKELRLLSEDIVELSYLPKSKPIQDIETTNLRKERLRKWLKHMFLNVYEEDGNLKVEEHLVIAPPFTIQDCFCDNIVILDRIRSMMELMPEEFT